ncbi:MAG: hypothetical protein AAB663_01355 [Patescibacteria group bacterium]
MAKLKILDACFDVDLTLTTFPAEGAYRAAGAALEKKIGADPSRRLLNDYHGIHANAGDVRNKISAMFTRQKFAKNVPEEVFWCRAAAFLTVLEEFCDQDFGLRWATILDALSAEETFWEHISSTSRPYDDTLDLIVAARSAGARLHLVTSSDVRLVVDENPKGTALYNPEISSALKRARVEKSLGRFHPLYIFEEHRKASREGWEKYVLPQCPDIDMSRSAIVGDSPGDVEAGVTMGMPVRILLDRNGVYWDKPLPVAATHVVRGLNVIPTILGW